MMLHLMENLIVSHLFGKKKIDLFLGYDVPVV